MSLETRIGSYFNTDEPIAVSMGEEGIGVPAETTPEVTPEVVPEVTPESTPEVTPEATPEVTPEVTPQVEIDEAGVMSFLSEKLGRQVTSFEELKPKEIPELDPQLKAIAEWRERTGRPLEDWIKFSQDFKTLSDLDVVRENIRLEFPTLTEEEIQLEMELNYITSEDDMDSEKALKNLKLKKDAIKGRATLDSMRLELDKAVPTNYPKEIQEELEFAKQVKEQQAQYSQSTQAYNNGLQKAASVTDKVAMKLSDTLTIDYLVPAEERGKLPQFINEMPHWKNPDGSQNHEAIIKDAIKIKNFDAMLKIAYEQGVSAGVDKLTATANNITLDQPQAGAVNPSAGKGYEVSGFNTLIGGSQIRIGRQR